MYEYVNNTVDHFAIIAHHLVNLLIEFHFEEAIFILHSGVAVIISFKKIYFNGI